MSHSLKKSVIFLYRNRNRFFGTGSLLEPGTVAGGMEKTLLKSMERETRLELALHLFEKSEHFFDSVRLLYRFLYRFRLFGKFSVLHYIIRTSGVEYKTPGHGSLAPPIKPMRPST